MFESGDVLEPHDRMDDKQVSPGVVMSAPPLMDEDYGRSVARLRDICVGLLNEVQTTVDVKQKLMLLAQVQELVLHQLNVVDRLSEQCLKEIAGYIGQLVVDRHQDVRKWMVSVLCEMVKEKETSLIPQTIEVLYHVIMSCPTATVEHDATIQAGVLKACLQGITDMFPLTFQRTCFFADEFRVTWQYVTSIKDLICHRFLTGDNEGLRTHAVKFVQTVILVFSAPSTSVDGSEMDVLSGVDIHANIVADDHPYLVKRHLVQEARDRLVHLLTQVHSKNMSSGNISAILNAMGSIVRSRPHFLGLVVDALLPLQKHPPLHLTPLQIKSLHHTLKLLLQSLLRLPAAETYRTAIHEVWTMLAGKTTQKQARSMTDRRAHVSQKRADFSEAPPTRAVDTADAESKRQRMHIDPELQKTLFGPRQFPYPYVLDLVMVSMLNLPARMPGYVSQHMADMTSRRAFSLGGHEPRKDSRRLDVRLQTRGPMKESATAAIDGSTAQQVSTVRTATGALLPLQSLAADIASFGQSDEYYRTHVNPVEVMDRIVGASHALRGVQGLSIHRMARDEIALESTGADRRPIGESGLAIKSEGGEEPRRPRSKPFVLEVTDEYSFDKLTTILKGVFERLISPEAEQLATDTGTRKAWITLICKLVTTDINDSIEMDHLKDLMRERLDAFILDKFKERYELAITWMYHEYAADEQRKLSIVKEEKKSVKKTKYPIYFVKLLHGLKASIEPNDKIFTRYVLDVPDLRETDLEVLREFCEDSERMALGLATLRDLVVQRSHSRQPALNILLDFCVHPNKSLRTAAILVVKKWVPGDTSYSAGVEEFACQHLEALEQVAAASLSSIESSQSPETAVDDEISRHLELYLALTSKKPELFTRIVEVYVKSQELVQKVIRLQCFGLIKLFGPGSPQLLDVLRDPPQGAETLALRILLVLTDKATDKPTEELVSIVKRVFEERHLDARFLIPILGSLDRADVIRYLPHLMKLPRSAFEQVVLRLVRPLHDSTPVDPTDLLFTLHLVEPSAEHVGLTKIKDATQVCLDMKDIFKQEVLAAVIQRLVDHTPLPVLLMRTLIQTATLYPGLVNFLNHAVARLILKKIWTLPQLWEGFIKYCQLVRYQAAVVVLQLPRSQALEVLAKAPGLRAELDDYFATHTTHQLSNKFHALFSESSLRERPLVVDPSAV